MSAGVHKGSVRNWADLYRLITIITLFSTDVEMDVSNFQLDHVITLIMTLIVLNIFMMKDVAPAALFRAAVERHTLTNVESQPYEVFF